MRHGSLVCGTASPRSFPRKRESRGRRLGACRPGSPLPRGRTGGRGRIRKTAGFRPAVVALKAEKSVVEERAEFPRSARMLELAQGLGLDLFDALAGHRELLADLFQSVVGVHAD